MVDEKVLATQVWLQQTYGGRPGWVPVLADGITGQITVSALIRALQVELGIAPIVGEFGPQTLAQLTKRFGDISRGAYRGNNVIRILQGGAWCKGYSGGGTDNIPLDGDFGPVFEASVSSMRRDLGLSRSPATVTPKMFRALLSTDSWILRDGGSAKVRLVAQALNARFQNRGPFDLLPPDGIYARSLQRALVLGIQFELGLDDATANANLGPATKAGLVRSGSFGAPASDTNGYLVHLFQASLIVNQAITPRVNRPSPFTGSFDSATVLAMQEFQLSTALPVTSSSNFATWASLLVSTGDPSRPGKVVDSVVSMTGPRLQFMRKKGFETFGRYLVNTPDNELHKCLEFTEASEIIASGGSVFPIFETGGYTISHFTRVRGAEVAEEASNAAWDYRIPSGTTIYFAVDFDASVSETVSAIVPYFEGVADYLRSGPDLYRPGVYAPRAVCSALAERGLADLSFVTDMSTGFSGNICQVLPSNWAFDQIQNIVEPPGSASWLKQFEYDKNVSSGRDLGVTSLSPAHRIAPDPLIDPKLRSAYERSWFEACKRYPDSVLQSGIMDLNHEGVIDLVRENDAYVTELAGKYGVRKALILTQVIWESLVINLGDDLADGAMYEANARFEGTGIAPELPFLDSSTGVAQIQCHTAIKSRRYAVERGWIDERITDPTVWTQYFGIWRKLHENAHFNIETALFVAMKEAEERSNIARGDFEKLTPTDIMLTYVGYNGGQLYGRNRAALYFIIKRWHERFAR